MKTTHFRHRNELPDNLTQTTHYTDKETKTRKVKKLCLRS